MVILKIGLKARKEKFQMIVHLTEANFEDEVMKSDKPVLVDFWAAWCGPCRNLAPVLEDLNNELGEQIKIGKVNVDEQPVLQSLYNIMSIPTLYVFKEGKVASKAIGARSKEELREILDL